MQEYSFIPRVHMESSKFWQEVNKLATQDEMDSILAYMYYMLKKAKAEDVPIKKDDFREAGKNIELFPGVETFFKRINAFGESIGVEIEHYIISSGLKEIIEGTPIYDNHVQAEYSGQQITDRKAVNLSCRPKSSHCASEGEGDKPHSVWTK